MSYRPTISIDFDGVLHAYTSGWKGATTIPDGPTPGAIEWLCDLVHPLRGSGGVKVVVCSARARTPWGWWAVKRWIRHHVFEHMGSDMTTADDICGEVSVTGRKPAAIVYVDDRAWRFDGEHFPSIEELKAHRPWCAVASKSGP